jgi:hypothetical protein
VGYFCCRSETTNALEKQDQQQSKDEKKWKELPTD